MSQSQRDGVVLIVDQTNKFRTGTCAGLQEGLKQIAETYHDHVEDYPAAAAIHVIFMDAAQDLADLARDHDCISQDDRAWIKRMAESLVRAGFVVNWPEANETRVADRADISLTNVSRIGSVKQTHRDELRSELEDFRDRVDEAFQRDSGVRTR